MPIYKRCGRCLVVSAVKDCVKEYEEYLRMANDGKLYSLTNHALGYHHGKVAAVEEIVNDLKASINYMEVEQAMLSGR